MIEARDISSIATANLCTGCGTCAAICPESAVSLEISRQAGIYLPRVNVDRCNGCGLCIRICPGHRVDFIELNRAAFGKEPEDNLLGNYLGCYTGHAADYDIRYNAASGGVVTALLIFALEQKIIDGALVTRMDPANPLQPQPFIARTKEEIISASKSKYCPVPANTALAEIIKEEGRFAVVGLPCHIQGLRKAEPVNQKLKDRIVLRLGLFCGSTSTFTGTRFILRKTGIKERDVTSLNFRGEGWPGGFLIQLRNGNKKFIPHGKAWSMWGIFFNPRRCQFCVDGCAELADISFGDAWLPHLMGDKAGKSIVICRSEAGKKLLESASSKGRVELNQAGSLDVITSQRGMLYRKKRLGVATTRLFRKRLYAGGNIRRLNVMDYGITIYIQLMRIYQVPLFRKVLEHMPLRVIKLHYLPLDFGTRYFYSRQSGEGLKGFLRFLLRKLVRV